MIDYYTHFGSSLVSKNLYSLLVIHDALEGWNLLGGLYFMSSITSEGNSSNNTDFNCFFGLFEVGLGFRGGGFDGTLNKLIVSCVGGAFKESLIACS